MTLVNRLLTVLFFLSQTIVLFGQTLSGKVWNEKKEPVPYANVVLMTLQEQFLTGTVTDEQGNFSFKNIDSMQHDSLLLKISSIGYLPRVLKGNELSNLPIILEEDTQTLGEVEIVANRIPYKMEQGVLTADVKNTVLAQLGTADDILPKLPFITGQNGSYTVFGKGAPLIYVNNRLVRNTSELSRLNARDIQDISVITTPGSEYDASVGAVIKITTFRRQGDGYSGNVYTTFTQGKHFQNMTYASLNYRFRQWDIFGGIGYNRGNRENESEQNHSFYYEDLQARYQTSQLQQVKGNSVFPQAGFNFTPNADHSAGISYNGILSYTDIPADWSIHGTNPFGATVEQTQHSVNNNDNGQHIINAYYTGKFGKRITLNLTADIVTGQQELSQLTTYENQAEEPIDVNSSADFDVYAGKAILDYTTDAGQLRTGTEYTKTRFLQRYAIDRTDLGLGNSTDKSVQNRFALFYSGLIKKSDWGMNAGLRYEFIKGDYFSNEVYQEEQSPTYHYFFPTASISYEPSAIPAIHNYAISPNI